MKIRTKKYEDISPIEFLVLKDRLGFTRYRKSVKKN